MGNENPPVRPRLRYVDVFPVPGEEGRQAFGIRDPQHLSDNVLRLQVEAACALQFFDGEHTLPDIQAAYREKYRIEFPLELLEQLCQVLDEGCFLEGGNFERHYRQLAGSFHESPVREAFHAGVSYEADPALLKEGLGKLFETPAGPGLPDGRNPERRIPGIIVPHIDLRLGGHAYAWAYKELAEAEPPELFVILGTGHNGTLNPYVLTSKRFATPLGEVPVEAGFVSRLSALHHGDLSRTSWPTVPSTPSSSRCCSSSSCSATPYPSCRCCAPSRTRRRGAATRGTPSNGSRRRCGR